MAQELKEEYKLYRRKALEALRDKVSPGPLHSSSQNGIPGSTGTLVTSRFLRNFPGLCHPAVGGGGRRTGVNGSGHGGSADPVFEEPADEILQHREPGGAIDATWTVHHLLCPHLWWGGWRPDAGLGFSLGGQIRQHTERAICTVLQFSDDEVRTMQVRGVRRACIRSCRYGVSPEGRAACGACVGSPVRDGYQHNKPKKVAHGLERMTTPGPCWTDGASGECFRHQLHPGQRGPMGS
jgi:hypothetical protein